MVLHPQSFCPRVCYAADCQYDVLNSTVTCSVWSGYLQTEMFKSTKKSYIPKGHTAGQRAGMAKKLEGYSL